MKKILYILTFILTFALCMISVSAYETGSVNCNLLNVRVSPSTQSDIVDRLVRGTQFEIIYTDNGWYNIRMQNGITGFVHADYVTKGASKSSSGSSVASKIAADAHNYIGYRYSYGSSGPNAFDCSGFTSYLYRQHGYSLPRTSASQGSYGTYIDKQNLIAGDLVFFSNRSDKKINHVGIYIGNNNFIHASTSTKGVVMDSLNSTYYTNHYVCARRVL